MIWSGTIFYLIIIAFSEGGKVIDVTQCYKNFIQS